MFRTVLGDSKITVYPILFRTVLGDSKIWEVAMWELTNWKGVSNEHAFWADVV